MRKIIFFILLLIITTIFSIEIYNKNFSAEVIEQQKTEAETKANEQKAKGPEMFGPWKVRELEEEGWTKLYTRVAPPKGFSRAWRIGAFKSAEFSTNPPGQNVFVQYNGTKHLLKEDFEVKGYTNFYFGSKNGKRVTVYIREGPVKN